MQTFVSDGVTLAYRDIPAEGADLGEPILLIHGFASSHRINWVDPRWATTLTKAGRRTVVFDNRGHGQSEKLYDPEAYTTPLMARDAANLLAELGIRRADVMGYSMGARIGAFLALERPELVRSLTLGGLGAHLVEGVGLPLGIADAMEAPSLDALTDPMQRMFRAFADQNRSDLRALAACIRGSRQTLSRDEVARNRLPLAGGGWNRGRRRGRCARAGVDAVERRGARHSRTRPQSRGGGSGLQGGRAGVSREAAVRAQSLAGGALAWGEAIGWMIGQPLAPRTPSPLVGEGRGGG